MLGVGPEASLGEKGSGPCTLHVTPSRKHPGLSGHEGT